MKKTSQNQPAVLDRNLLSKKQDLPAMRITRPRWTESARACESGRLAQKAVRSTATHPLILPHTCLRNLDLSLLCFLHLPFFPSPLCSSACRKYPEYLSGESRRLPTRDLCQRDGDQPQLRAPHLGRGSQPHPGQMQHLPAGRAQCKPHRVAAAQGAKQRQHLSF